MALQVDQPFYTSEPLLLLFYPLEMAKKHHSVSAGSYFVRSFVEKLKNVDFFRLKPSNKKTLIERCIAKSREHKLSYLSSLGIQSLALSVGENGNSSFVLKECNFR
jgi:hypothetical protein